jgi:hypothetical protein
MGIAYSYKRETVTVTADDGTTRDWPLATFEADPAACVAQTGNGIEEPTFEPSADEKIAALEASLAAERAKVGQLENFLAGNGNAAAPDARTDIKAIIAALTAKEVITIAEIDAQRRSSYRDNGDGTISLLDKFGSPSVTFIPGDDVPEASVYATWLAMSGKPMPPAAALEANNAP